MTQDFYTVALSICSLLLAIILVIVINSKRKKSVHITFSFVILCLMICCIGQLASLVFADDWHFDPVYFDYFVYIGTCFLPVAFLFFGISFSRSRFRFKKKYLLLFIVPIISLLVIWTNDFHHLFYVVYNVYTAGTTFGPYFYVHSAYSYVLLFIALFYLIRYTIKNSGFFSKQSVLILTGSMIPIAINFAGVLGIPMTIYLTPISFTVSALFFALAILKFKFLSITPIALQNIVDKISDGYIVIDDEDIVTDYNKTFLTFTGMENSTLRGRYLFGDIISKYIDKKYLTLIKDYVIQSRTNNKTYSLQIKLINDEKYFNIEITSMFSDNLLLGTLILFKDTTQHILDLKQIQDNQSLLMERERLASLGQLIGGIAHNLKTPIMSISGAAEGITDLINEYNESIGDPEVTFEDHHAIAKDMFDWVTKIKSYTEYMSDVITAVKGQAVTLSENVTTSFDLDELVKRVNILMKHELKNALITLNVKMNIDKSTTLNGDITSLVQVINNMISNSIQSYNGEPNRNIDLILDKNGNNIVISVKDYGCGLPEEVQNKLFKEMITTKGKNGTGLGLFMSYSTIRAHFNGDITFQSEVGKGTIFNIIIPISH